jgi:hypothetical protein
MSDICADADSRPGDASSGNGDASAILAAWAAIITVHYPLADGEKFLLLSLRDRLTRIARGAHCHV